MSLLERLLRGRPMERVRYAFTDDLTGMPVYYYRDRSGRLFMARSRWSLFRVRSPSDELPEDRVGLNSDLGRRAVAASEVCDGSLSTVTTALLLECPRCSHAAAEGIDR